MCCKGPAPVRPNFTILCIGLEKAGKSSILATLSDDDLHKIEPTIGNVVINYCDVITSFYPLLPQTRFEKKKIGICFGRPDFMILSKSKKYISIVLLDCFV